MLDYLHFWNRLRSWNFQRKELSPPVFRHPNFASQEMLDTAFLFEFCPLLNSPPIQKVPVGAEKYHLWNCKRFGRQKHSRLSGAVSILLAISSKYCIDISTLRCTWWLSPQNSCCSPEIIFNDIISHTHHTCQLGSNNTLVSWSTSCCRNVKLANLSVYVRSIPHFSNISVTLPPSTQEN